MQEDQQLAIATSTNNTLSMAFHGLRESLHRAAVENVNQLSIGQANNGFTELEKVSMVLAEELHLTGGMDLANIILRYQIVREIRDTASWSNHPEGYTTLEQLATAQHISKTELSDLMVMNEVVFPWIEVKLETSIAQVWDQVGKSNFKDMLPVLRTIISHVPSGSVRVNEQAAFLLNETAATLTVSQLPHEEEDIERETVRELIVRAGGTNATLRDHLRPDRTDPIEASVFTSGTQKILAMVVTEDQLTMLHNKMGAYLTQQMMDLPQNTTMRQRALMGIEAVRKLVELVTNV